MLPGRYVFLHRTHCNIRWLAEFDAQLVAGPVLKPGIQLAAAIQECCPAQVHAIALDRLLAEVAEVANLGERNIRTSDGFGSASLKLLANKDSS